MKKLIIICMFLLMCITFNFSKAIAVFSGKVVDVQMIIIPGTTCGRNSFTEYKIIFENGAFYNLPEWVYKKYMICPGDYVTINHEDYIEGCREASITVKRNN